MSVIVRGEIVGGEALAERLSETESERSVTRLLNRIERVVENFRGEVLSSVGSSLTVSFDEMENACRASCEMQRRVDDLLPISGLRLSLIVAIFSAQNENTAITMAGQLLARALPEQILGDSNLMRIPTASIGLKTRDLEEPWQATENGQPISLMEILWRESESVNPQELLKSTIFEPLLDDDMPNSSFSTFPPPRLRVSCTKNDLTLDETISVLTIGRDKSSDISIKDDRVSRFHARIVLHDRHYVLEDSSTNGTFVSQNGAPEVFVCRGSITLHGKGVLSMGLSALDQNAYKVEYEYLTSP